jgi:uroporphyrinogen decarboxylase
MPVQKGDATSKAERVTASLRGDPVDRVPVSAWWHDFAREWSAAGLAEATLEAYRRYDWDYIKVNPRASYYAEDYGARFQRYEDRQPDLIEPAVRSPEDLRRIQRLDVTRGAYGEQLEALRLIAAGLGGEAPFIQTVFSPLAVLSRATGSTKFVQRLIREHPDSVLAALDAVTETLALYARACLSAGAAGIFFATVEWGSADNIAPEDYDRFGRPFDLRVLQGAEGAPFNVLHVCRGNNRLAPLLDYPVAAFHWDAHAAGNPSFADIAPRTERALMGGVSHESTMAAGQPQQVMREARAAIGEAGGRRFLLAPGCSIAPAVPEANIRALVEAARA